MLIFSPKAQESLSEVHRNQRRRIEGACERLHAGTHTESRSEGSLRQAVREGWCIDHTFRQVETPNGVVSVTYILNIYPASPRAVTIDLGPAEAAVLLASLGVPVLAALYFFFS